MYMLEFRWDRVHDSGHVSRGGPAKVWTGYVLRKILGVDEGQARNPNEGPRWWKDPKAEEEMQAYLKYELGPAVGTGGAGSSGSFGGGGGKRNRPWRRGSPDREAGKGKASRLSRSSPRSPSTEIEHEKGLGKVRHIEVVVAGKSQDGTQSIRKVNGIDNPAYIFTKHVPR